MVVRRVVAVGAGEVLALEKQGREMPMRGREIGSVGGAVVLPGVEQCRKPLVTLKPAGYVTFCSFGRNFLLTNSAARVCLT